MNARDEEMVPAITRYIRIPARSLMFDADWEKHGLLDQPRFVPHAAECHGEGEVEKPITLRVGDPKSAL